ncbi:MAG: hypothetical protein ABIO72_05390 [Patescibacteria group bacterium]
MRHFYLASFIMILGILGVGCSPQIDDGSGGSGGASSSSGSGSTTINSTVSTGSTTDTSSTTSATTGATTASSTGTGMQEFFSCADVAAHKFVIKVRADVVPDARQIRLGGQVVYPQGQGFSNTNWGVRGTGPQGAEEVTFDLGEAPSDSTANLTLGTIGPGETTSNPDGIVDGYYYCPNTQPFACGLDILGCYGTAEIGRYVDGVAYGGFSFMSGKPNPTFVTP